MMKNRLALFALLALAVSPLHASELSRLSRLDTELPRLMRAAGIPGLSMAVIRDGQVAWTGALGVTVAGETTPVKKDTVFRAASLTKPVFSYLVLRLADRGVIDLDTPLSRYLPYPRLEHDKRAKRITARHVLSHTTGLPNWALGQDHIPVQFAPGKAWGYSGEGFVYLQKAVEKLTGKTLADLARQEVFGPLGMTRSSLVWDSAFESNAVSGVDNLGAIQPLPRSDEANAAASLSTTAEDYSRFLVAVLEGRGLKKETQDAMLTRQSQVQATFGGAPKSPKRPDVFWGLGWGLEQVDGADTADTFWHWGHEDAWRAYVLVRRDGKSGLVYFANSHEGLSIARAVADLVVEGPRPGLDWLDYERHDDPRRITRKEIDRAFREGGTEAGSRRFRELHGDGKLARGLAELLMGTRPQDAVALLRAALESEPKDAGLHAFLGQALLTIGEDEAALAEYETAAKLDPERQGPEMRKWLRDGIEARKKPVVLPEETLRRFAGKYGSRNVAFEGGSLHYQREGKAKYRLIPIGPETFAVETNGSFRVRFKADGSAIVVIQPGDEDESARDK